MRLLLYIFSLYAPSTKLGSGLPPSLAIHTNSLVIPAGRFIHRHCCVYEGNDLFLRLPRTYMTSAGWCMHGCVCLGALDRSCCIAEGTGIPVTLQWICVFKALHILATTTYLSLMFLAACIVIQYSLTDTQY
ncbi:hypothetical protein GGR54DRAFT_591037 [Hypoxylon sp. NC1633]|nr:hypothetical protein GGR54DRAFT_591037 [Hypoxylon sp. NC1633]